MIIISLNKIICVFLKKLLNRLEILVLKTIYYMGYLYYISV